MVSFEKLLEESGRLHGHLCPGQVLGVRLALLGCRLVGIVEPTRSRRLIVWVEIDRCATDAIQAVTGCKLGNRTLKYLDFGKVAATFSNMDTGEAVRVVAREDSRDAVWKYASPDLSKKEAQLRAYKIMPDEELFTATPVKIEVSEMDMPGHPLHRVICEECGEGVNDGREIVLRDKALCRACAGGAYYQVLEHVFRQEDAT